MSEKESQIPTGRRSLGAKLVDKLKETIFPAPANTLEVLGQKFSEAIGEPIISDKNLKVLAAAEIEWRKHWEDANERYTGTSARKEYTRLVSAKSSETVGDTIGFKTLVSDYEARCDYARSQMRRINEETMPLVKAAIENFVTAGTAWIQVRAATEQREATEFGVPYNPSQVLVTAQRTVATHKVKLQNLSPGASNPLAHLNFIRI